MDAAARILAVDDDAGVRFFLEETLTNDGHRVTAVESGEEALELIAGQEFDLALIDLRLKGVGGIEVLRVLRQQSPDTVVVMLTGYGSMETAVEALRQGAHDYLFKPCKTVELRESVRTGLLKRQRKLRQRELLAQLQQSLAAGLEDAPASVGKLAPLSSPLGLEQEAEGRSRFLQKGGLIVDFMRHVITLDGKLLELSPTEFDLLAYLVSESPRVVSPQKLVREVQGYESEPWEARDMVRYHVYRIRQKVKEATGQTDVIRTVRGVGYKVEE